MKIISFNINGLRARLHQLKAIIDRHEPDVIGLQETKVRDEMFPVADVEAMGYTAYCYGQKAHYGVALLCKNKALSIQKGFPTDSEKHQKRVLIATFENNQGEQVTVLNGYFPQGDNIAHERKYAYKRQFFIDLMNYLNTYHSNKQQLIIMGDVNISPIDIDIGIGESNRKRWLKIGKCSFQPEERNWLKRLFDWGFQDTFRNLYPKVENQYSWFDYRSRGFEDNRGLRIDLILATPSLAKKCIEVGIDYELRGMEKSSDHAPIWSVFE
ncbi:exodeoxyribonuclease III [Candidatus Photodesmus blepharus]|uniref:Exodeoxyribonuclease III n=1 Tax=Candidatus Photodesmus blepharonis TaxID=1179155 RepID=A0A084CN55_9GAMM|nr:exodeoxyribonuclease III [Candidatus Photodesmus blepharus]KEY91234.1 exodeoxyribonuclease III [Candidatus Photodesmus blepharus]